MTTICKAASDSVIECATVKAVTILMTGQAARPQDNRDQERDMVVAKEDMLDAGVDITKDHMEQWRGRGRDFDFGLRRVQQRLRCIRLSPDKHDLLGAWIDIDQYRRAIDQVALDFIA